MSVQKNISVFEEIKQDTEIKHYGIINKNGRLCSLDNNLRGLEDLEIPKEKKEQMYMQIALHMSMLSEQNEDLGHLQYSMVERKFMKMVSIPVNDNKTLVLILDKKADHQKVLNRLYSRLYLNDNVTDSKMKKGLNTMSGGIF